MIKKCLIISILFSQGLFITSYAQTFRKFHDQVLDKFIISYYNVEAQVVIQKIITKKPNDTVQPIFEIGLILYDKTIASDDFMKPKATIVFDDQSYLTFEDPVLVNYLYAGKHAISVRHKLTEQELKLLQLKNMKFFRIYNLAKTFDKWQPDKLKDVFIKIETEEPN